MASKALSSLVKDFPGLRFITLCPADTQNFRKENITAQATMRHTPNQPICVT